MASPSNSGLCKKMEFKLLPSLEDISLANMAVALWKAYSRTCNYDYALDYEQLWNTVESEVTDIVSDLPLPIPFKEKILAFSKQLHVELEIWVLVDLKVPEEYISMCVNNISWTNFGTIDSKITAVNLVKNEHLPITTRYELACRYCLVDDIHKLYGEIPDDSNYRDILALNNSGIRFHNPIIFAWTNYLREGFLDLEMLDLCGASKAAAEYALEEKGKEILTREYMHQVILLAATESNLKWCQSDVIIFLLEQMDVDQLKYIMFLDPPVRSPTTYSAFNNILWSMVHWPWKYCFAEPDACTCRGYCDVSNFSTVLRCILSLCEGKDNERESQDNETSFHKFFWENLSDPCRKAVMETEFEFVLLHLFAKDHHMRIEPILGFFPDLCKIQFFRKHWQVLGKDLIDKYNFHILDLFIREVIPSRDEMICFKEYMHKEFKKKHRNADMIEALQLIDGYIFGIKQSRQKVALQE